MRHLVIAATLAIVAWATPSTDARAQTAPATGTSACTQWITSVPYDITTPGYYCLKQNLATNLVGGAIMIDSSDVTLDCRGRSISHTDPNNEAVGIGAAGLGPIQNVTIRNCRFMDFSSGIVFYPGDNIEILSNDILRYRFDGITSWANHTRVANNNVLAGFNPATQWIGGIVLAGSTENVVANNIVSGTHDTQFIMGIRLQNATNTLVNNNQIVDLRPTEGGYATAIEIDGGSAETARVVSNLMMTRYPMSFGISASMGATCTRNLAIGLERSGFDTCTVNVNNNEQP